MFCVFLAKELVCVDWLDDEVMPQKEDSISSITPTINAHWEADEVFEPFSGSTLGNSQGHMDSASYSRLAAEDNIIYTAGKGGVNTTS